MCGFTSAAMVGPFGPTIVFFWGDKFLGVKFLKKKNYLAEFVSSGSWQVVVGSWQVVVGRGQWAGGS